MRRLAPSSFVTIWILFALSFRPAFAGEEGSAAELAKQVQNPVSSLITVPFQYNATFGAGSSQEVLHVLNVQPVVPFSVAQDWNLVLRAVVPFISQPDVAGTGRTSGLGDITFQPLFSPKKTGKLVWGVGPALIVPSATSDQLGSGKWSAGPIAVLFTMDGPWVAGVLVQNVWSFAGDSARPGVNQLTLQPAINYNLPGAWAIGSSPVITADWTAPSGGRWTVPLGATVSKTTALGKRPITLAAGAFWNAAHPDGAGDWQLRFQIAFLFPQKPKP
jgi:hypothetical protein